MRDVDHTNRVTVSLDGSEGREGGEGVGSEKDLKEGPWTSRFTTPSTPSLTGKFGESGGSVFHFQ